MEAPTPPPKPRRLSEARFSSIVPVEINEAEIIQSSSENDTEENEPSLTKKENIIQKVEPAPPKVEPKKISPTDYRLHVVNEVYDTEDSYVSSLKVCKEGYYTPLSTSGAHICPKEKLDIIFSHFDDVLSFNTALFMEMKKLKEQGVLENQIGTALFKFAGVLNIYKLFVSNSDTSFKVLDELEKNTKFNETLYVLRNQLQAENQLDLRSYLIMPVQRLPRYRLLLTDLIKHTDDAFPDKPNLQKALEEISKIALVVNETIKERERKQKLVELTKHIEGFNGELITPYREMLKDGKLKKICRKNNKERYFYLFNDVLTYGIGDEKNMKVSGTLKLETLTIRENKEVEFSFQILSKKSFSVIAENKELYEEWFKAISDAINQEKSKTGTLKRQKVEGDDYVAPIWVQDTANCQICNALFTTFFRKHHCRKCGLCVCADCSKQSIVINKKKERVCDRCAADSVDVENSKNSKDKLESEPVKRKSFSEKIRKSLSQTQTLELQKKAEEENKEQTPGIEETKKIDVEDKAPELPPKRKSSSTNRPIVNVTIENAKPESGVETTTEINKKECVNRNEMETTTNSQQQEQQQNTTVTPKDDLLVSPKSQIQKPSQPKRAQPPTPRKVTPINTTNTTQIHQNSYSNTVTQPTQQHKQKTFADVTKPTQKAQTILQRTQPKLQQTPKEHSTSEQQSVLIKQKSFEKKVENDQSNTEKCEKTEASFRSVRDSPFLKKDQHQQTFLQKRPEPRKQPLKPQK
ncbi:Rho/RAC guanine nucleotide exchange factor, putative [Entamoeba invadens IP1]|uniref:Rho/RAC guanine nucleotide exchange factor, putative n=1 Tax=Entamoeba invadens IP1 TaxID=370355 RepID=UPI0002C3F8DA|nr:Rho/RAC guanine nucleotide exchange factor, putative [Entamoeba invadens IP1]ELP90625.1 Rho/RAC guanine nucleotide exchange factor, putative [Entamoeba invadens IP1]|eukprot:XP_004257396.1 Rho/RAC guanine nucleotide exchange factor, putative [Entamoeba invadens IP1]